MSEPDFKSRMWERLRPWVKDFSDVGLTVAVIIVILRVLLGANMLVPMVVVTSSSMMHMQGDNSWRTWMTARGLPEDTINSFPLQNGFNRGDMIIVKNPEAGLGDVVIYERDLDHQKLFGGDPIIHRVVGVIHVVDWNPRETEGTLDCITPKMMAENLYILKTCQSGGSCSYPMYPESGTFKLFVTKGDNNEGSDQCSKRLRLGYLVNEAQITGRGFIRIPYIGYVKLLMNAILDVFLFPIRLLLGV
jgi:hypothetical protein